MTDEPLNAFREPLDPSNRATLALGGPNSPGDAPGEPLEQVEEGPAATLLFRFEATNGLLWASSCSPYRLANACDRNDHRSRPRSLRSGLRSRQRRLKAQGRGAAAPGFRS